MPNPRDVFPVQTSPLDQSVLDWHRHCPADLHSPSATLLEDSTPPTDAPSHSTIADQAPPTTDDGDDATPCIRPPSRQPTPQPISDSEIPILEQQSDSQLTSSLSIDEVDLAANATASDTTSDPPSDPPSDCAKPPCPSSPLSYHYPHSVFPQHRVRERYP